MIMMFHCVIVIALLLSLLTAEASRRTAIGRQSNRNKARSSTFTQPSSSLVNTSSALGEISQYNNISFELTSYLVARKSNESVHRLHPFIIPSIFDLPRPQQLSRRLFVSYCIDSILPTTENEVYFRRQMDNYVSMCEDGYEVHVVVTSIYSNWVVEAQDTIFGPRASSRYYCIRLGRVLPIVFDFVHDAEVPANSLPAMHRYQFLHFKNGYDLFLVQEGDIAIRVQNLDYFSKWSYHLRNTHFLPAFDSFELQWHLRPNPQNQFDHMPGHMRSRTKLQFFSYNDKVFYTTNKIYQFFSIFTADMVDDLSSLASWFGDLKMQFCEPNVYFSRDWMARHYIIVFPLYEMNSALVRHASDRYAHWQENKTGAHRWFRIQELQGIVNAALTNNFSTIQMGRKDSLKLKTEHVVFGGESVESCISKANYFSRLIIEFKGTCTPAEDRCSAELSDVGSCFYDINRNIERYALPKCGFIGIDGKCHAVVPTKCNPPEWLGPIHRTEKMPFPGMRR